MTTEIQQLMDEYTSWLRAKISLRKVDDWVEITTPYLDRHNDYLQIYARRENGSYILTDDGYILHDLKQSGCDLDTPKRSALLNMTLNGFGVKLVSGSMLEVRASYEDFPSKKHSLLQAMLAINDLFYLAQPNVASLFLEDFLAWLEQNYIRYVPNVKFAGKSGYDHLFDAVIPGSRQAPERVLQAINRPDKNEAQALAFSWMDTREVRKPDSKAYAFLNDSEKAVPVSVIDALHSYEIEPVSWSNRAAILPELTA
jgi:hypothetical protein